MKINDLTKEKEKTEIIIKFVKWAINELNIKSEPNITIHSNFDFVSKNRTFGSADSARNISVYLGNRNVADLLRTLCHELVHYKQFSEGLAHDDMDEDTRQNIEDVANAMAGRMLRQYGKQHAEIYSRS